METTNTLFVRLTSAFSVEGVQNGLGIVEGAFGTMYIDKTVLKEFQNAQLVKMIKSLDSESSVSHKDAKDVLVPTLYKLIESLDVDEVVAPKKTRQSSGTRTPRENNGPSTKNTCYEVFKDYNLADKDESKAALTDAMKACGMEEDDVKGKRVVQSYMSYYRADVKSGKITETKTVYVVEAE